MSIAGRVLVPLLIALVGAAGASALPDPPRPPLSPLPSPTAQLDVGPEKPLEWKVQVIGGWFLHVTVEQIDVDAVIELHDADGHELRREDLIRQPFGHERMWWLVDDTATLRVRIIAREKGRVRVEAFEAHPATDDDRRRARAEHLLVAGLEGRNGDAEGQERGVADLAEARRIFADLDLHSRVCRSLCFEGQVLRRLGRLDDAEARLHTCVALAEEHQILDELAVAWLDLSAVALSRGDVEAARALNARAQSIRRDLGE